MHKRRTIQLQIIPGKQDIEEIVSEIVELGEDSNIMSLSLARALGTKVTRIYNLIELIDNEPISIYGITKILIRLPPAPKTPKIDKKFMKVEMRVIENLDTKIRISKNTQMLLNILPNTCSYEKSKDYHTYKNYKRKQKNLFRY